jgi:hypothetical protein
MSKIFLPLLCVLSSLCAQAQLFNSDFEKAPLTPAGVPHWFNMQAFAIGLNDSIVSDGASIDYSNVANTGSQALILRNWYNYTQNYTVLGSVNNYDDTAVTFVASKLLPLTQKPYALELYYWINKKTNVFDSTKINVRVYNSNEYLIGEGIKSVGDKAEVYKRVEVPINYLNQIPTGNGDLVPAKISVGFSNTSDLNSAFELYNILIDDAKILYAPLNVNNITKGTNNFYPNPTSSFINWDNACKYFIYNLKGQILTSGFSNKVDVQALPKGTYILKTENKFSQFIKL